MSILMCPRFVIFLYLCDIQQENDTDFAIYSGGKD